MAKECRKCGDSKPLHEFNRSKRQPDGFDVWCKTCRRAYDNAHYARSERRQKAIRDNNKRVRQVVSQQIWDYLSAHPCECGESDPVVLQFDHRDGTRKLFNISDFRQRTWKAVEAEIEKCDVRCANCHLRRTAQQFGWYAALAQR